MIIINESQLRLIVENGVKKERLLTITIDMIVDGESFDDILDLYNTEKEKKNFVGIKLLGNIDFSRGFGNKIGFGVVEFCDELVEVNGDLRVVNNYTIGFPKLRVVTGDMLLSMVDVRSLPKLRYVGRNLTLRRSKISELPELESVGGSLDLERSQINSLPNLESVGGFLDLNYSKIESLPKLESVGEELYLGNTPLLENTTEEELRSKINVEGKIYL